MKKIETKSAVLLKHHLKALRLPAFHAKCEKVAARCATDNVDRLGFLLQLCELELIQREKRAAERRLKAARFACRDVSKFVQDEYVQFAELAFHPHQLVFLADLHQLRDQLGDPPEAHPAALLAGGHSHHGGQ